MGGGRDAGEEKGRRERRSEAVSLMREGRWVKERRLEVVVGVSDSRGEDVPSREGDRRARRTRVANATRVASASWRVRRGLERGAGVRGGGWTESCEEGSGRRGCDEDETERDEGVRRCIVARSSTVQLGPGESDRSVAVSSES